MQGDAGDVNRPAGRMQQSADKREEGGFPGSRGTEEQDEFAGLDLKIDAIHGPNGTVAGSINFADILQVNEGGRVRSLESRV